MRAQKLFKSSLIIIICQLVFYFAEFICRVCFIHCISIDYVGVKGLFSNILSVLSLSELGIGTTIVFALYKPVAQNDTKKILALTRVIKIAYLAIAPTIFLIGCCIMPFLPHIIKDCPDLPDLSFIFFLYLISTVVSYFNTYKQTVFNADEKYHINALCYASFNIARDVVQIILLLATHNLYLYIIAQAVSTIVMNLYGSRLANKYYPFLKDKTTYKLPKEEIKTLWKNIIAMFQHQIGTILTTSTDNIIISKFVSLTAVALSDNYNVIFNMLNGVLNQVFSALMSSIGNLNVTAKKEDIMKTFYTLHFMNFWFYTFCSCGLLSLLSPVIKILFGDKYVFSTSITIILVVNFYLIGIKKIPNLFKQTMGLLRQDRWIPILEAFLNLGISIIGANLLGTFGVYLGTFLSCVVTTLWVEPYILFRNGFQISIRKFWTVSLIYYIVSFAIILTNYKICTYFIIKNLLFSVGLRLIITLVFPNLLIFLLFRKKKEMQVTLSAIRSLLPKF